MLFPGLYESNYPSYSATAQITLAALATDFFTIVGSASRIVGITEVAIQGNQTTAAVVNLLLAKRSTDNAGGTFTNPAAVPWDALNAAATAAIRAYTANPAGLGNLVGNPILAYQTIPASNSATYTQSEPAAVYRHQPPNQPIMLRGVNEILSLNLNGVTLAGGIVRCTVKWFEI